MGYDLIAYFDNVDQDEIETFITQNNIDREDWDQHPLIESYFKNKYLNHDLRVRYEWDTKCKIHTFYDMYSTSFIRDDARLTNRIYHKIMENKLGGIPFPDCLQFINWTLRRATDAVNVSRSLRVFFPDDVPLMKFADWLDTTAQYCSIYELSH